MCGKGGITLKRNKKIIEVLESISTYQKPGKKTVQKLLYLIERRGVELDLDYRIHFFGPYSSTLDDTLHALQNNDVLEINTSGPTHTICVKDASKCEGEELSSEERKVVDFVISNFGNKSALELEAITTLDYVANSLKGNDELQDSDIIEGVQKIKGTKFNEQQLSEYLSVLKKFEFLN
ncbi:MAG TPA: hypothetical protein DCS12_03015 [Clostridiales bacterium]|nr:hypothetical protein [Clostridiales bacterium]